MNRLARAYRYQRPTEAGCALNEQTDRWLAPMVKTLLESDGGPGTYPRLMEAALVATPASDGTHHVNVDFVLFVRLIRKELDWNDYPIHPLDDTA